jgi:hypothetical protein
MRLIKYTCYTKVESTNQHCWVDRLNRLIHPLWLLTRSSFHATSVRAKVTRFHWMWMYGAAFLSYLWSAVNERWNCCLMARPGCDRAAVELVTSHEHRSTMPVDDCNRGIWWLKESIFENISGNQFQWNINQMRCSIKQSAVRTMKYYWLTLPSRYRTTPILRMSDVFLKAEH